MSGIDTRTVTSDEAGMRLDRWFKSHYPGLGFGQLQKLLRTGQVRVDGGRVKTDARVAEGQKVRIPPIGVDAVRAENAAPRRVSSDDREAIEGMILFEDKSLMVLNKPAGLSVQGGSGTTRHIDGMLETYRDKSGDKPRLVHRIDKDTAGCLVVAKTRKSAQALTKAFRARSARKIYWALVKGVPKPHQGKISTFLARDEDNEKMAIVRHGEDDAQHAVTYYAVVDHAGQNLSWVSFKPVTGRTHQLRLHAAHIGCPIIGDPKYFNIENWEFPGGMQNKLHLLARRIVIPHPGGGKLDVTAPLPPHMQQSWNLLGFDSSEYDPIEDEDQQ
ncbi:RluA family pseudouridine synthase [Breoghania sp. L-A4]|uniref:RluA family pseudouridine synthase n=1 Tax=Breoghania sp. L-A4 TaxID=2304600 RepID=UPI000E35F208|nr:RluA family pseudouridine synthase [Breoghania sp. L-A4]AXS41022.1 RluA family pseudouridine synthase [Breoghania sp. L-A4]